jgi:hypothetical protein
LGISLGKWGEVDHFRTDEGGDHWRSTMEGGEEVIIRDRHG